MWNNKPNAPKNKKGEQKYRQGNYIPKNVDKVIRLNSEGGIYYRSSWERTVCQYLDNMTMNEGYPKVKKWGCEVIKIPYTLFTPGKGNSEHSYYPDFYYELEKAPGEVQKILLEVKPKNEMVAPKPPKNATRKQLENFEYLMKMWHRNQYKWDAAIRYCEGRDIKFSIFHDDHIKMLRS